MVSGLVTSPWDHERIFSGLAKLMRMESKSAIWLARSYGLERYKGEPPVPEDRDKNSLQGSRKNREQLIGGGWLDLRLLPLHQFDVQTERLQLADEHVERFRHSRFDSGLALHNGLVNFGAAVDIVGLRREQFLENVRGAVRFERPHFHFSKSLAAELRFAAERLLGDQRVRPDGTRVNLVVDQMRQLEHVNVTDGDLLRERVSGHAVVERDLARFRQARRLQQVANVFLARAVEDRRGHRYAVFVIVPEGEDLFVVEVLDRFPDGCGPESVLEPLAYNFRARTLVEQFRNLSAELLRGPAEVRFENLAHVHTRRNAERIEHNLHRRAVWQIRHVFRGNDARDDALVAVASGHFVANGKLALHGDIDFDELNDARRQFVALFQFFLALLGDFAEHVDLPRGHFLDLVDFLDEQRVFVRQAQALQIARRDFLQNLARQIRALGEQTLVGALVVQVSDESLPAEQSAQALQALVGENADFIGEVLFELEDLRGLDRLVAFIFLRALAAENLHVDDGAFDSRRTIERSVANVSGLFAEDRAQQFLFRRQRGFALGRYLADEDVTRLHRGADADDAAFVEIAQEALVDVGNVPSDFLRTQLCIARLDFVLLDVNRSVVIVLHELFADQDGVFEVVSAPRQERDKHVAAERQFAAIGARTVGQHLPLANAVACAHQRLLADASVLVRALEFSEQINVRTHFAAEHAGLVGFDADDDALGVDLIHDAVALATDHCARIVRRDALHACADERCFALNERHSLALHVRAHQRAVRVVVLKEWNQTGRDRDKLLWRNVDVIHFLARFQHEVAGLPAVDKFRGDFPAIVERSVGLRDHVAVLFPCGKIEAIRFGRHFAASELFVR